MSEDEKRRWHKPADLDKKGSGRRVKARKVIAHNAKTESSKKWLERQLADPYVQKAFQEGYRARAAYKLLEIDERFDILKGRKNTVDLGCAPGGWLQVLKGKGMAHIAGIDLLPVEPLTGVHIVEGDINIAEDVAKLWQGLAGKPDLVLSDMAANTTGHRQTDHLRTIALVESAVEFTLEHLQPGGTFCAKVFQGGTSGDILKTLKENFQSVRHIKPPASRAGSPEIFVIAKGFQRAKAGLKE